MYGQDWIAAKENKNGVRFLVERSVRIILLLSD